MGENKVNSMRDGNGMRERIAVEAESAQRLFQLNKKGALCATAYSYSRVLNIVPSLPTLFSRRCK